MSTERIRQLEREIEEIQRKNRTKDSAIIGGVTAGLTDSALLGTGVGVLLGGDLVGAAVGSVVGDILSGGGLFD